MRRMVRSLMLGTALACASASAARAQVPQAFFDNETVAARKVAGTAPRTDDDPRWAQATAAQVVLAPQLSVRLNDKDANAALATRGPVVATVSAVWTDAELAVRVVWTDPTEDRAPLDDARANTTSYGDAVALEFPAAFGAGQRLPHIGMGDEGQRVVVLMQRAFTLSTGHASVGRSYVAAGFGSITRAGLPGMRMTLRRDGATWRAVFVRALDGPGASLRAGLVPFAVAVWDGAARERGGNKALSSWKALRLEGLPLDEGYARELAWGYGPGELGDVQRGKQLTETVCAACHRVGGKRNAPDGLAPELTGIGAYSTASYLRESIVDPHAVVVENLNINRHTARAAGPDATGAFASNEAFRWSVVDALGKRRSKMPSFAGLPAADVAAMVAYLKSLGAPAAPASSDTKTGGGM